MATNLQFTQATGTSTKKFTFSCWVKVNTESDQSGVPGFFSTSNGWADGTGIAFAFSSQELRIYNGANGVGGSNMNKVQDRLFRDPNAWYHLVFQADTDESAIADRMKVYVNGTQQTLTYHGGTDLNLPAQGASWTNLGVNGQTLQVGSASQSNQYFDGIIAHAHFCDGYSYSASTFGETDSTTGIWKPKTAPSVTYGTNGFFLKFENSGSMGTDSSGNANNFTVSGTCTQTIDTPSNVFATWNGVFSLSGTLSNGNNTYATADAYGSLSNTATSTLGVSSGKYYAEFKCGATTGSFPNGLVGVYYNPEKFQNGATNPAQSDDEGFGYAENGNIYNNSSTSTGTTYTNGDIIGIALDLDGNKVYWYKNGTLVNTGGTTIDAGETYFFFAADTSGSGGTTYQANFGNGYFGTTAVSSAQNPDDGIGIFEYDVPAGYRALCTKSINAEEYS